MKAERYRAGRAPAYVKDEEKVIVDTTETKQEIKKKPTNSREQNYRVVAEIIEVVKKTAQPSSPPVVAEVGTFYLACQFLLNSKRELRGRGRGS
jgi:hypothetical protein